MERFLRLEEKAKNHDWFFTVIAGAGSVLATIVALKTGLLEIDSESAARQAAAYQRLYTLETSNDELRQMLAEREAQIVSLNVRLAAQMEDGLNALFLTIEAMQTPAWVKQYIPEADKKSQFVMIYINSDYEHEYNVTRSLYQGRSDFDIYSEGRAMEYYANDMAVVRDRGWLEFYERDAARGSDKSDFALFWKFYVEMPDRTGLVVGMRVLRGQQPPSSKLIGSTSGLVNRLGQYVVN